MEKQCRCDTESDNSKETDCNTVFIDTNLDTHLAMIVSVSDTVSDLKKKVVFNHLQCFPELGQIKINALKVKRKGHFYHLSDSMLVKRAFEGGKRGWFLSVDASSLKQHGENRDSCKPSGSNQVPLLCITYNPSGNGHNRLPDDTSASVLHKSWSLDPISTQCGNQTIKSGSRHPWREMSVNMEMEVKHITNENFKIVSADSNRIPDLKIKEKDDVSSNGNSYPNGASNIQCNNSLEQSLRTGSVTTKKRKIKKINEDAISDHTLKENFSANHVSNVDASCPEIVVPAMSLVDAEMGNIDVTSLMTSASNSSKRSDPVSHGKSNMGEQMTPLLHVRCENDKFNNDIADVKCNSLFEETSPSGPVAKKKRQTESKKGSRKTLEVNSDLVSNSSKETFKPEIIVPENTSEGKHKRKNTASGSLPTEIPDNDHLRTNSSSGKNKRKKKRNMSTNLSKPCDQDINVLPSTVQDVEEQRSLKENEKILQKDLHKSSDAAIIVEHNNHPGRPCASSVIPLKKEQSRLIQEEVEGSIPPHSSVGNGICEHDAGGVRKKKWAKKSAAVLCLMEGNESKRKAMNASSLGADREGTNLSEIEAKRLELTQMNKELSLNFEPEVIHSARLTPMDPVDADINLKQPVITESLDAKGVLESGNLGSTKRKKKRAKESVSKNENNLVTKHANNVSEISLTHQNSSLDGFCEAKKGEIILSQIERKEVSKEKTINTSSMDGDREVAESLQLSQKNTGLKIAENGNVAKKLELTQMNKELSLNLNAEVIHSNRLTTVDRVDADINLKLPVINEPSDAKLVIESGNLGGTKRKKKRAKESVSKNENASVTKHAKNVSGSSLTNPSSALDGFCEAKKGELILSQIEREEFSKEKKINASSVDGDREDAESLQLSESNRGLKIADNGNEAKKLELTQMNKEFSSNLDAEVIHSNRLTIMDCTDADINLKQPVIIEPSDAKGVVESGSFGGTKSKKRRGKESASKNEDASVKEYANNANGISLTPPSSALDGFCEAKKGEIIVSHTDRKEVSKEKTINTSSMDDDREDDNLSRKGAESLQLTQTNGGLKIAENVGVVSGKKVKKNQQAIDMGISDDRTRDVDSKLRKKKTKMVKTSAVNQYPGSEFGVEENNGSRYGSSTEQISENVVNGLSADLLENNSRMNKAKVESHNQIETSKCDDDGIDFTHYFVQGQHQNEVALTDNVKETTMSKREVKTRNSKKNVLSSVGTSQNLPKSRKSYENKECGIKSHKSSYSADQRQESISSKKKSSNVFANGLETPDSHGTDLIQTPQPSRRPIVASVSENSTPASCPNTGSSDKSFQSQRDNKLQSSNDVALLAGRKASSKNIGEVVNGLKHEKNLLTTPAVIFRDDSTESSDENGTVDSDASTRTPSDNLSSSDSEGESESSPHPTRNGSNGMTAKKGGENMKKSQPSGAKNLTMDMIFRSSSRFKKAKLTASQSQLEDIESQPVDFVPDSQATL